ncbi:MAG: hypothetical protein MHM6MM_005548 [Cercozoa sp. M6MM]
MFLYLALADLLPELLDAPKKRLPRLVFIVICGCALMLISWALPHSHGDHEDGDDHAGHAH